MMKWLIGTFRVTPLYSGGKPLHSKIEIRSSLKELFSYFHVH